MTIRRTIALAAVLMLALLLDRLQTSHQARDSRSGRYPHAYLRGHGAHQRDRSLL